MRPTGPSCRFVFSPALLRTVSLSPPTGTSAWVQLLPDAALDIERSGAGFVFFRLSKTGNTVPSADMTLTSGSIQAGGTGSYRINLVDGDGWEMEINNEGKLTVTGGYYVNATELTVPDYVFDPGYKLRPIDELAGFIAENRHLPAVPSAAEIKQQGSLDVTGMQLALLEKVEELTLYTIKQHETIQQLQSRLETLEGQSK